MTVKEDLIKKAKDLLKNEEFDKAIKILEDLYQRQSDVDVKNNLIEALFAYGGYLNDYYVLEYDESINFFKRIIELDSDNYRAHYNLGIAYFNLNRFEEALNSYKIAISIKPDYKHVYYNIGLLHEKTENLEKAIEFYEKALEIDPNYIYAMHALHSVKQILNTEANKDNQSQKRKNAIKKLISLLKVSKRLRIDIIQEILKLSKENTIELLIKWGEKFNCEIDGDFIIINRKYLDELLEYLDLNGMGI